MTHTNLPNQRMKRKLTGMYKREAYFNIEVCTISTIFELISRAQISPAWEEPEENPDRNFSATLESNWLATVGTN